MGNFICQMGTFVLLLPKGNKKFHGKKNSNSNHPAHVHEPNYLMTKSSGYYTTEI